MQKLLSPVNLILLAALLIRIALSPFGTLELDQNTFISWSNLLRDGGFTGFYSGWSDYLPGYLYILRLLASLQDVKIPISLLYKLPAIFADLATGALIYAIVVKYKSERIALLSSAFYLFNPAVLANSAVWGQVDGITALFSLLSIWLLEKQFALSSISLALGILVKPQAVFIIPALGISMLIGKWSFGKIATYGMIFLAVFLLGFVPFAGEKNLIPFVIERLSQTLGQYPYTSVNAFNLWAIGGMWKPDTGGVFPLQFLGYFISGTVFLGFIGMLYKRKLLDKPFTIYWQAGVLLLISFLFFTRIHERHMLPALAPLVVAAAFIPALGISFIGLSVTYVLNLYYAFIWITSDFQTVFSPLEITALSLLNLFFFIVVFVAPRWKGKFRFPKVISHTPVFSKHPYSQRSLTWLLGGVLVFSLITRFVYLGDIKNEYFDEVYHAFTAKVMLHGDPKAWEWWNTPPEGFAYEWTHPPLAKEGMWLSMAILGENAFAYRLPAAILGVLSVYLVYKITLELFSDKLAGIFAALVFSLDGLVLVMSRIGMNDMYLLTFLLLSYYFFLKDKHFFASLALGFAAASKWSSLWFLPILAVSFFALRKKFKLSLGFYFLFPPLIYIASYIPMFLTGHGWDIFIGVQKQMWWYHTNLEATHAYTSPWWSWPLSLRPLWMYANGGDGKLIGNIYAMGNPLIFWGGLISVFYALYWAFSKRLKTVGLLIFAYFAFFVPWALSPRIMFIYHYLPSVPFLAIILGITLRKHIEFAPAFFALAGIMFLYFFPHWTGIPIPTFIDSSYYWFSTWR